MSAEMVWRPIETAPKDGTWILAYRKHDISQARWQPDVFNKEYEWGGKGWSYPDENGPTHWMPLPEPPK